MKKVKETEPTVYLAMSENGGFQLMYQGQPMTAEGKTEADCLNVAGKLHITVTHIWDGINCTGFSPFKQGAI